MQMRTLDGSKAARFGLLALLASGLLSTACGGSPNQGIWRGTFDGTLTGTVEFQINASGTELTGTLEGATSNGQEFAADMEGKLRDTYFYATFEGKGQTGILPVPFEGFMKGELAEGNATGDWSAELRTGWKMSGSWDVEQVGNE